MTTQQLGIVPIWTVGDRLRKAREVAGYEQGPFAAVMGISRGTVSNYERDLTSKYKPIVINTWADKTGVSVKWLTEGVGDPTPPDDRRRDDRGNELAALTRQKLNRSRIGSGATDEYLAA